MLVQVYSCSLLHSSHVRSHKKPARLEACCVRLSRWLNTGLNTCFQRCSPFHKLMGRWLHVCDSWACLAASVAVDMGRFNHKVSFPRLHVSLGWLSVLSDPSASTYYCTAVVWHYTPQMRLKGALYGSPGPVCDAFVLPVGVGPFGLD